MPNETHKPPSGTAVGVTGGVTVFVQPSAAVALTPAVGVPELKLKSVPSTIVLVMLANEHWSAAGQVAFRTTWQPAAGTTPAFSVKVLPLLDALPPQVLLAMPSSVSGAGRRSVRERPLASLKPLPVIVIVI